MCIILWILYFSGYAIINTESTRPPNYSQLKIIGGTIIPIRRRPFMVSLHSQIEFICGGSILSSVWIMTAEHCIDTHDFSSYYYIRAGSSYSNHGGAIHTVINFETYSLQSYKFGIPTNDIILLKISPPLEFSLKIQPVKLPSSHFTPNWLWVSGWGRTETKLTSDLLRIVRVPYISYERCTRIVPSYAAILNHDYHMCYGDPGYDSCYGDSGGPLASSGIIYGIVSFGNHCGKDPGVYTKVFYYLHWIKEVIELEFYD